jgi:rubredoxin
MAARTTLPVVVGSSAPASQRRTAPVVTCSLPQRAQQGLRLAHRGRVLIPRATDEVGNGEAATEDKKSKGVLDRNNPDLVEKFATIGTGSAECKSCQYVYEPKMGDPNYPVAKGTLFEVRCWQRTRPCSLFSWLRQAALLHPSATPLSVCISPQLLRHRTCLRTGGVPCAAQRRSCSCREL